MNPYFATYIKKTICLLILLSLFSELSAQKKKIYPELDLYNKTLSAKQSEAYNKAFNEYRNNISTYPFPTIYKDKRATEAQALSREFTESLWGDSINYSSAFVLALELENLLDNITEEEYPNKRFDYFRLGEAYYLFNDFYKSINILKKVISEHPPRSFTDCTNLDARRIMGICYAELEQMDISDYYLCSILESPDLILDRPVYNAYALSYLATNAMIRGKYTKALVLNEAILPFFRDYSDYGHLAGMFHTRFKCYLVTGDIYRAGIAADSVLYYADRDTYHPNKRHKMAFSALLHYNAAVGNAIGTEAYSDSLMHVYEQEALEYTSQYIADARQEKSEHDAEEAQEKAEIYRRNMITGIIISILVILFAGYTIIQYRRLRTAYRALAEKSRLWAEQINNDYKLDIEKISEKSLPEEIHIMQLIHNYIIIEKHYLDVELTLDKLAKELTINRSYLSSSINNITGKNFNSYVNEYRIASAIHMLNNTNKDFNSIDDIYIACGFNSKRSFYYSFKKITGITPGEYRDNLTKN